MLTLLVTFDLAQSRVHWKSSGRTCEQSSLQGVLSVYCLETAMSTTSTKHQKRQFQFQQPQTMLRALALSSGQRRETDAVCWTLGSVLELGRPTLELFGQKVAFWNEPKGLGKSQKVQEEMKRPKVIHSGCRRSQTYYAIRITSAIGPRIERINQIGRRRRDFL